MADSDKKENLTDMSDKKLEKSGYADEDGYWTDKGYDNATDKDYERLGEATRGDDDDD